MSEVTCLTNGQVFGDDTTSQLEIFKKRGTKSAISDYAIALGGFVSESNYASDKYDLANRTGAYWLKDRYGSGDARAVDNHGWRSDSILSNVPLVFAQLSRTPKSKTSART